MRRGLLIGLVLLLVLTGFPVLMSGMAGTCSDCPAAVVTCAIWLVAVLVSMALVVTPQCTWLRRRRELEPLLLRARFFDRPPQLTTA